MSVRANQTADPDAGASAPDRRFRRGRRTHRRHPLGACRPSRKSPGWCWPAICLFFPTPRCRNSARARSGALATAYRSAHDGLPEPLCAIWEPAAAAALADYQAAGADCPRKFLIRHAARLLEPLDRRALDNVNTPEEYAQALAALDAAS